MRRELAVDRGVAPAAVGERVLGLGIDRDDVHERVGALEVRQERVPEPDAVGGALEQAGDVGDGELPQVVQLDRAELGRERRERVVGDLRRRVRDAAQERRLAGVREAEQRGVADHLEAQLELGRLALLADLRGARRLADGRREAPVAAPAAAAARDHDARPGVREVGDRQVAARRRRPACRAARARSRRRRRRRSCRRPAPCTPRWPRRWRRKRNAERSRMSGSASSTTSPPSPPSPPSGPPLGTNFSRRNETQPSPPRPACDDDGRAIVEVALAAHAARSASRRPRRSRRACRGGGRSRPCP